MHVFAEFSNIDVFIRHDWTLTKVGFFHDHDLANIIKLKRIVPDMSTLIFPPEK